MPTFLQASISSVPARAVSFLPSTVRFTSAMGINVRMPELLPERDRRHRSRIAQRTKRPPQHVLRQVLHVVDIFLHAAARMETNQSLLQPIRPFAAGNAPSATFMLVKLHSAQRKFHNALLVVHNNDTARTQHGSGLL